MTRALSLDLRERVVAAIGDGASCREAAKTFSVSVASAARWSKRARDTGSAAPLPFGRPLGLVLLPERDWLLARVAAAPDLTIRALRAELEADRGVRVGYGAVWRFLAREALTIKKKLCTPPSSIGPMSPASVNAGSATKDASTPSAWSSWTKPGPRPT